VTGLDAVYGEPLDGVAVIEVPVDLAPLLAEAHRRLRGRPAGVHTGDGRPPDPPSPPERWVTPPAEVVEALRAAERPAVLAGPGVVLDGAVPGLHALAAAGSLGVLNTWGAKGVFDWRSRHHLATVGLQDLDFARGGLADADLIVATGVEPREAQADWRLAPVVEVAPGMLGPLAEAWGRPRGAIAVPPLRAELARVTQAGWAVEAGPLPPTRVTRHYGEVLGATGVVAADPGVAGYWVARTFPTSGPGGAQVPADPAATGFAVACVIVAGLFDRARPVLAVVDELGEVHERLLEVAGRLGIAVPVEVWSPDGDALDASTHRRRLERLVAGGGWSSLATDPRQLDEMVAVAGPIVAWTT
jgi:thiamine pyrophosphate-dependent acetolactate synthase large subunit-like protein